MPEKKLKRNYKDSLFRMIFNNEEKIRELYNALEDTSFGDEVPIIIETLENALFVDVSNDLAFQIDNRFVVLVEHQSTLCENMPYRMLGYTARTFERIYKDVNFFSTKKQHIMAPEFYVLYNGTEELPEESVIRLSDCYIDGSPENSIEIVVKILDVSYNKDKKILKKSRTLYEYSRFIQIVRETLAASSDKEAAAKEAVRIAMSEGLLKEFLGVYGLEAADMAFREFNYEEFIEQIKQDYFNDGVELGESKGKAAGLIETYQELGISREETVTRVKERMGLSVEEAEAYMDIFWKE